MNKKDDGEETFKNEWTCSNCGEEEHDAICVMDGEIEVDVTCENVYFTFNDNTEDPGMAFDHETFEMISDHYESVTRDEERVSPPEKLEEISEDLIKTRKHVFHVIGDGEIERETREEFYTLPEKIIAVSKALEEISQLYSE